VAARRPRGDGVSVSSRSEAQQRADGIRIFRDELARLEREGVVALDEGQRRAVTEHHRALLAAYAEAYDIDRDVQSKQLSLGMRIASFLGALALAASVFFLFYQFWGLFPTVAQVGILLAAAFGTLLGTYLIQRRDSSGYFTKLAAMVAFACFVLDVAMLGQIFDITPSDKALLPWAALALLLAYGCDLRLLQAAGILCLGAFIAARTGTWSGMYWIHFGERPENFFPAAIAAFAVPQLIDHRRFSGFDSIYRVFGLIGFLLPVLILSNWGEISYLDLDRKLIEGSYQILGFAVSAGAVWLGTKRHWTDTVNTGVTFFVIFLYTKFYDWWWEIMPKYLFFLIVGLSAVLLLFVFKRLRGAAKTGGAA
jgi:uncharacterized membrane protein